MKSNFFVLSGFKDCLSIRFLDDLISFSMSHSLTCLLLDSSFKLTASETHELSNFNIHFFEWGRYLNLSTSYIPLETFNRLYLRGFDHSNFLSLAAYKMLLRLPNTFSGEVPCLPHSFGLAVENFNTLLLELGKPLIALSYDIPHSSLDYLLMYASCLSLAKSYYFRSTGLLSFAKSLHKANDWQLPNSRKPLKIYPLNSSFQHANFTPVLDIFNNRLPQPSLTLPYSKEKQVAITRHNNQRKEYIYRNISHYASKLSYLSALKREYINLSEPFASIPRSNDFVVYYLHREPEASTMPESLPFFDQHQAISFLRSQLPPSIHIFIKEHPETFKDWETLYWPHILDISPWRPHGFYEKISKLANCSFLTLDTSFMTLSTANPLAFVTLTGSIYSECLTQGIPCIAHPCAPFAFLPGIVDLFSKNILYDLKTASELIYSLKKLSHQLIDFNYIASFVDPINLRVDPGAEETHDCLAEQSCSSHSRFLNLLGKLICM